MVDTPPPGERIAKAIARSGRASRRDAEQLISEGRVRVNGRVIESPALNVTADDAITVDGAPLPAPEPPRLWLYHKPKGLVTTAKDEKGRPTVFAALPEGMPRALSVGRLDLNSEGLLLLTNDGALKRRMELPATGWLRRYRVRVKGTPTEETFEPLRRGLEVEGETFQPMTVSVDRQQGANAWVTVALREGRNREIRRAMEAVGLTVNRLIRVSYGPFQLGNLEAGAVEEVRSRVLRDQLGLDENFAPAGTPGEGRAVERRRKGAIRKGSARKAAGGAQDAAEGGGRARPERSKGGGGKGPRKAPGAAARDAAGDGKAAGGSRKAGGGGRKAGEGNRKAEGGGRKGPGTGGGGETRGGKAAGGPGRKGGAGRPDRSARPGGRPRRPGGREGSGEG